MEQEPRFGQQDSTILAQRDSQVDKSKRIQCQILANVCFLGGVSLTTQGARKVICMRCDCFCSYCDENFQRDDFHLALQSRTFKITIFGL